MLHLQDEELEDKLEDFCEMEGYEQSEFLTDYRELADYSDRLFAVCDIEDEDDREDELGDLIYDIFQETDYIESTESFEEEYEELEEEINSMDEEKDRDYDDYLEDRLTHFCDMSDEDKRQFFDDHPRIAQFSDILTNFCDMSGEQRDIAIDRFVDDHEDDFRNHIDMEMRDKLERYCEMSDTDKRTYLEKYDKTSDHAEKMDRYCTLSESGRTDFIAEHREEYKAHMKDRMHDKMTDKKKHHMNYDRLCAMAKSDRAAEITDVAKLDRINNWCDMTPDEREDYKKKHHADMKHKMSDKMHDKMSCPCHSGDDGTMQCPMIDEHSDMQCFYDG